MNQEQFEAPKPKEVREVEFHCQKCGALIIKSKMAADEAAPYYDAQSKGQLLCAKCRESADKENGLQ